MNPHQPNTQNFSKYQHTFVRQGQFLDAIAEFLSGQLILPQLCATVNQLQFFV